MNAEFDRHELRMKQISTLRSNIIMAQNDKIVNPLSFSTQIQRSNESNSFLVLTNK